MHKIDSAILTSPNSFEAAFSCGTTMLTIVRRWLAGRNDQLIWHTRIINPHSLVGLASSFRPEPEPLSCQHLSRHRSPQRLRSATSAYHLSKPISLKIFGQVLTTHASAPCARLRQDLSKVSTHNYFQQSSRRNAHLAGPSSMAYIQEVDSTPSPHFHELRIGPRKLTLLDSPSHPQ